MNTELVFKGILPASEGFELTKTLALFKIG
jgi:hypothetical protein